MDKKLKFKNNMKKIGLFIKKYWLYFLIAVVAIIAVLAIFPSWNTNNFWFGLVKKLMKQSNKVNEDIKDINRKAQEEEDKIRREYTEDVHEIQSEAEKEQEKLRLRQQAAAHELAASGKNDPEVVADQLSNAFGLPKGEK